MRIGVPRIRLTKRRLMHIAEVLAKSSLPEIAFIATLVLSRYQQNIDFSYPSEVVIPIILFGVLATGIYYGFRYTLRRHTAAHFASLPLLYGFYIFQMIANERMALIKAVLPKRFETSFTTSLVLMFAMVLAAGVFGYITAKVVSLKRLRGLQVSKMVMFFVLFLFVTQAGKVGLRLAQIYPELTYQHKPSSLTKTAAQTTAAKPDIYYIVLDRYASAETLKNDYGYDNSSFMGYLSKQGFVIRDDAHSNYPFTMSSISSTLAMGYHTALGHKFGNDSFQTAFPYRSILNNPPIAEVLKQDGYTYNQVSSWWDFTRLGVNADTNPTLSYRLSVLGMHFYLSDLTRDIVNKSVFSPLLTKGVTIGGAHIIKYDLDRNPQQNFEAQISALKSLSGTKHDSPQFTFAHFLLPHDPYIFDEAGAPVAYDSGRNDSGVDESIKYTSQLTYLNARIQDAMGYIRAHSPDAVIVLQSDEGPYPRQFRFAQTPTHYYNPADLPATQIQQKFGVLAAYYMPGIDPQTVKSAVVASVDPFRFVLANYLGYDMPMLPDCQFATGNKYSLYRYQLVTDKLTGVADPRCSKL